MAYRKATKLRMLVAMGFLGILMTLKPPTCRAQAEINPDHYDTPANESTSTIRTNAKPIRTASSSRGKSTRGLQQQSSASAGRAASRSLSPKRQQTQVSGRRNGAA